jgi:hypothetical protein
MVDVIPIIPFVNLACLLSQPSDNNTKPQASRQVPRIRTRPAPCTLDLRDERITFPLTPPPSLLSSQKEPEARHVRELYQMGKGQGGRQQGELEGRTLWWQERRTRVLPNSNGESTA